MGKRGEYSARSGEARWRSAPPPRAQSGLSGPGSALTLGVPGRRATSPNPAGLAAAFGACAARLPPSLCSNFLTVPGATAVMLAQNRTFRRCVVSQAHGHARHPTYCLVCVCGGGGHRGRLPNSPSPGCVAPPPPAATLSPRPGADLLGVPAREGSHGARRPAWGCSLSERPPAGFPPPPRHTPRLRAPRPPVHPWTRLSRREHGRAGTRGAGGVSCGSTPRNGIVVSTPAASRGPSVPLSAAATPAAPAAPAAPLTPRPRQHLVPVVLAFSILTGVRSHLMVV